MTETKKEEKLSVHFKTRESGVYVGEEVGVDVEVDAIKIWFEKNKDKVRTGRTIVVIHKDDKRHIGISLCNNKDQFNRKVGKIKAMGRATAELVKSQGLLNRVGEAPLWDYSLTISIDRDLENKDLLELNVPTWMLFDTMLKDKKETIE